MEITNTPQITPLTDIKTGKADLSAWQVGKLLNATVVNVSSKGDITLQINNTLFQATGGPVKHYPGEALDLKVLSAGITPVLKVVNKSTLQAPVADAMKMLLPRQMPMPLLLSNITYLANSDGKSAPPISSPVAQIIKKFYNNLPSSRALATASGVKETLLNSGQFMENKLLGSNTTDNKTGLSLNKDFKVALLRLHENLKQQQAAQQNKVAGSPPTKPQTVAGVTIKPLTVSLTTDTPRDQGTPSPLVETKFSQMTTPPRAPLMVPAQPLPPMQNVPLKAQTAATPSLQAQLSTLQVLDEIIQQLGGALARLNVTQLSSLPVDNNSQPVLSFELPIRHEDRVDVIQLRIYEEQNDNDEEPRRWSVSLSFDLHKMGPVYAIITLSDQNIWTKFWAEKLHTVELIDQHIQKLHEKLQQSGLNVGAIHCAHGNPPHSSTRPHQLIDMNV